MPQVLRNLAAPHCSALSTSLKQRRGGRNLSCGGGSVSEVPVELSGKEVSGLDDVNIRG
jgi:hypothetical protein